MTVFCAPPACLAKCGVRALAQLKVYRGRKDSKCGIAAKDSEVIRDRVSFSRSTFGEKRKVREQ